MTKKDYVLIADALIKAYQQGNRSKDEMFASTIGELSHALWSDNSRFDKSRFQDYIVRRIDSGKVFYSTR